MAQKGKTSKRSANISKGIIFTFFIIYLLVFGVIITGFSSSLQIVSPESFPIFITYIPLLCYIGALFCGFGFLIFIRNATVQKSRETQSRKKIKSNSLYKQALFLIIFIFAFVPILSPAIDQGKNTNNFSVYNTNWNGGSELKIIIEDLGYEVMTVQSSLSATERIPGNKSKLLILLGPNQFYDPIFEIPYFINFFKGSNSLLLCHDHGSTSILLWEIFVANMLSQLSSNQTGEMFPVTLFPDGILRDNESYYPTPEFPIIKDFDLSHPTTTTPNFIDEVILSRSSAAAGGLLVEMFGWDIIGSASNTYSWVDKNGNGKIDPDVDVLELGFMGTILSLFSGSPIPLDKLKLPLYSPFTPHVFLAKDMGTSRIFVSADASLFNNELIDDPLYDNTQFAQNIIQWLTYYNNNDWIVIFDEAHIRPENSRDLTSAGIFGFIMQYIVHLSTNPITAWIYPLLAFYTLRKYLPKKDKKAEERKIAEAEEKKEERARFRTSSFFAQKIEEYRDHSKYTDALILLYRRLERKLNSQLQGQKITTQNVVELVVAKDPSTTKLRIKRISRFMDKIISIKDGKYKVRTEEDFENLFYEMGWTIENL
ncbi:hypothetical protein LCGC14_0594440 [marine sediment metagenome]|uniref:DUF4350 domain-containing protein n=1 Tax=marine sediment metagenome TaxID=412755 RepID=A0A0F9TYL2_9ZZZZ